MIVYVLLAYIIYIEDKLRKEIKQNNEPKSIFPEPTEELPVLPKVTPVGTTDSKNVHAIENVSFETIEEHFEDMFQGTSAWQKGFTLEDQVI